MQVQPANGGVGHLSARAVVFEEPQALNVREVELPQPQAGEVVVDVEWTGISTGTEKLLWDGRMPMFPGMGYPLVPGYETVGRISASGGGCSVEIGDRVFVSGAHCFGELRGLFGGAASRLVVDEAKVTPIGDTLEAEAVLLALAATAHHAVHAGHNATLPELIIGHGVLGRLIARLTVLLGGSEVTVWETNEQRAAATDDYAVINPALDDRRDYRRVVDASGDAAIIDKVMQHLGRRGEIVLAGFYAEPLSFNFPPAFMREAMISIAAEWRDTDLDSVRRFANAGALSFEQLITHRVPASEAHDAYATAFADPDCLKMVLDWRNT